MIGLFEQISLFPNIANGNVVVSRGQRIILNATETIDSSANTADFNWIWTCKSVTFGIYQDCLDPNLMSQIFTNSPVLSIPAGTFWLGNLTITLNVQQINVPQGVTAIKANTSVCLNVLPFLVPYVGISGPSNGIVTSNQTLILYTNITSLTGDPIVSVNVYFSPSIPSNSFVITCEYNILVQPNTFQPGIFYNVTVEVQDINGISSASLPLFVDEPPLGGRVDVQLLSQDSNFLRLFIVCSLWEDDLYHQQSYTSALITLSSLRILNDEILFENVSSIAVNCEQLIAKSMLSTLIAGGNCPIELC